MDLKEVTRLRQGYGAGGPRDSLRESNVSWSNAQIGGGGSIEGCLGTKTGAALGEGAAEACGAGEALGSGLDFATPLDKALTSQSGFGVAALPVTLLDFEVVVANEVTEDVLEATLLELTKLDAPLVCMAESIALGGTKLTSRLRNFSALPVVKKSLLFL